MCSAFRTFCPAVSIHCAQSRKDAFDSRKRELKALGLGQDGRPMKKVDEGKEKKSRGKVPATFINLFSSTLPFRHQPQPFFVNHRSRRFSIASWSSTVVTSHQLSSLTLNIFINHGSEPYVINHRVIKLCRLPFCHQLSSSRFGQIFFGICGVGHDNSFSRDTK